MSFNSKYEGEEVEQLLDKVADTENIISSSIITRIEYVSELPSEPDPTTMYLIP